MADYRAPVDDIRFIAEDVFNLPSFWSTLDQLGGEVDMDTAQAIIDEAAKVCEQQLAPLNREADEHGCQWHEGKVTTPPGFKEAYKTFCEGGWGALGGNPAYEGMGMPKTLVSAIEEMVQGSCMAFGLAPMLTAGACLAIDAHASEELKQHYLPRLYSGEWSGAMDLTEPHAGTDLGIMRTKAVPQPDGSYAITGTKIFITWGEHDMAENIVHLVLAKLPDAPPGSKGISLFLVPKFLSKEDGTLGQANTMGCGSIEKKMGIKASATCVMNYDGATGWLIGEENRGLQAMFTMMNYERLVVGIQGLGVAEASYQSALAYAKERVQSRAPTGTKAPDKEADPIIYHPDVQRMLLTMQALNEGGRAFTTYVAMWLDSAKYLGDTARREHAEQMVSLLTPVAKAFMTDLALETAILGQQVLGGHGYIREWGQEQHVRDLRITQIYEGTNGIQAMDLIARKVCGSKGKLVGVFIEEAQQYLASLTQLDDALQAMKNECESALRRLQETTDGILQAATKDPNAPGAVAVDYLNLVGYTAYAYMWLRMALAAQHSDKAVAQTKMATARFYFAKILPRTLALAAMIRSGAEPFPAQD